MNKRLYLLPIIAGLMTIEVFAQDVAPKVEATSNKGKIYAFWGWNRGWYSDSDIHFTGDNYDFTLNDVEAKDRQSKLGIDPFLNLGRITIPQTNFRIGYFINDKIDISIGVDHMKYVMVSVQETEITGNINSNAGYDGSYINNDLTITEDFLKFEHTDGLNYLNAEITYNQNLLDVFRINLNPNKIELNYLVGFGIGVMMPRSNVTLMDFTRYDEFHFAGYGFAAKTGLNLTFYKHFFIRTEYKAGFIDMPDIRTTPNESDKASQHFLFTEWNFGFGVVFKLFK